MRRTEFNNFVKRDFCFNKSKTEHLHVTVMFMNRRYVITYAFLTDITSSQCKLDPYPFNKTKLDYETISKFLDLNRNPKE
ncbi:MAG: hypothetical protein ACTSPV_12395 [Candidatus Hodarchaeales archaeon]